MVQVESPVFCNKNEQLSKIIIGTCLLKQCFDLSMIGTTGKVFF